MIVTYFVMRSDAGCTFLSFHDALNVMHVVYQTLGCKQVIGKSIYIYYIVYQISLFIVSRLPTVHAPPQNVSGSAEQWRKGGNEQEEVDGGHFKAIAVLYPIHHLAGHLKSRPPKACGA